MLTVYVTLHEHIIITVDGSQMRVKTVLVRGNDGFVCLQDYKPPKTLESLEFVLGQQKMELPLDLKKAVALFMQRYHTKQNLSFDCYAFANLVKEIPPHEVQRLLEFWEIKPKPEKVPVGAVVLFCSGENCFHHAAISIGADLYLSVYGAGGDLEVSTLADMEHDFKANKILLATPRV